MLFGYMNFHGFHGNPYATYGAKSLLRHNTAMTNNKLNNYEF